MASATHVYRNGTILTMDSGGSQAQALAVRGGTILAVGTDAEVMALADQHTVVTDLRGRTMLPGFIDGHSHFVSAGLMAATQIDLSSPPVGGVKNIAEIKELIRAKAAETPKGEWILGFGYDDTGLEDKRHPLASDIDEAAPEHPVLLRHVSGHLSSCNSLALAKANYTKDTPDPVGGVIRRDEHGNPNGVLEEPPGARTRVPPYPGPHGSRLDGRHQGRLRRVYGEGRDHGAGRLYRHGRLERAEAGARARPAPQPRADPARPRLLRSQPVRFPRFRYAADRRRQDQPRRRQTPRRRQPAVLYRLPEQSLPQNHLRSAGRPPVARVHSGNPQGFIDRIVALHREGWQIAIHGNGDEAIQLILDAYEEAQKRYPRADARHIIIHCQTVREDQLDRIKRLGVVPSASSSVHHLSSWAAPPPRHSFLPADRARRISPLRSALKRGIRFSNHNDTFVTP